MKSLIFCKTITVFAAVLMLVAVSCIHHKKGFGTIYVESEPFQQQPLATVANGVENKDQKIKFKYAKYLGIPPDSIRNVSLYVFIDSWLSTPYLWGGTTRQGIDCSAFTQRLLVDVYNISLPRTSIEQYRTNQLKRFLNRKYLREGDLIFFTTTSEKEVSHVGLYLGNNMFVNASTTYGVSIANINTRYWSSFYVASGRVTVKKS